MKAIRCKVCKAIIARISGDVKTLRCSECGATRNLHYKDKPQGFKLTMRV